MARLHRLLNAIRKPQYVVCRPGDVVIVNGKPYAVYPTHLTAISVKPLNKLT